MSLPGNIGLLSRLPSAQSAGYGNVDGPASSTDNAVALFNGTTGKVIKNSDLIYSGSSLTSAQPYLYAPSGNSTWVGGSGFDTRGFAAQRSGANAALSLLSAGSNDQVNLQRANGTLSSQTAVGDDTTVAVIRFQSYNGSNFVSNAEFEGRTHGVQASGTNAGGEFRVSVTPSGQTSPVAAYTVNGAVAGTAGWHRFLAPTRNVGTSWGTNGVVNQFDGNASTDTASSGTVATAVGNSFAAPTFAASSATTYTNAANLYIAGDITAGTNVTLTNSYGLWNVGKTRLDGAVLAGSSITTGTPNGGTSGAWKFGIRTAATVVFDTTQYIQLDVGGTLYKLALAV